MRNLPICFSDGSTGSGFCNDVQVLIVDGIVASDDGGHILPVD